MEALVIIGIAFVLLFLGVPIGISFLLSIISGILIFDINTIEFVAQGMYNGFSSLALLAIPAYILAGMVMEAGGLSARLVNMANKLVGGTKGGLGAVTILACLFFGAISGSAPATVAAIGAIMIPHMVKAKYDKDYATGLISVAGGLGVVVPPSIPFVIYGVATNTSIGDLFVAGIVPALLIAVCLLVVAYFTSKKRGYVGTGEKFSFKELGKSMKEGIWALIMPVIILGGIYGGIFTPTEAGMVALFYGIIIGKFVYKELSFKKLLKIFDQFVSFAGGIVMTFAPAITLGAVFALLDVPQAITTGLMAISGSKIVALLLVNVFLLVVGMLLDSTTAILILAPMLLAALQPFGVDPVHLGLIMTVNLAVGFVTPPVAANLFVASGMTGIPVQRIARVALPFIIALVAALLIITFIPAISLVFVS